MKHDFTYNNQGSMTLKTHQKPARYGKRLSRYIETETDSADLDDGGFMLSQQSQAFLLRVGASK